MWFGAKSYWSLICWSRNWKLGWVISDTRIFNWSVLTRNAYFVITVWKGRIISLRTVAAFQVGQSLICKLVWAWAQNTVSSRFDVYFCFFGHMGHLDQRFTASVFHAMSWFGDKLIGPLTLGTYLNWILSSLHCPGVMSGIKSYLRVGHGYALDYLISRFLFFYGRIIKVKRHFRNISFSSRLILLLKLWVLNILVHFCCRFFGLASQFHIFICRLWRLYFRIFRIFRFLNHLLWLFGLKSREWYVFGPNWLISRCIIEIIGVST